MAYTLMQLADLVHGDIEGDADTPVTGVSGIKEATAGDITFLANEKYYPLLEMTNASAAVVGRDIENARIPVIKVRQPDIAFVTIVDFVLNKPLNIPLGVHPTAAIGKGVKIGEGASIQAYAVIADGSEIGNETVIYPHCYVGHYSRIGEKCLIYPNVTIRERSEIGDRVIIHAGTVIGSDGFGFATLKGVHLKIPQIGIVHVEDDVEIGACVTIDRARFDKTAIGAGTKIDNLVQIAHNVRIGRNCFIVAGCGIAGSATIGDNVTVAGQAGVGGHIKIGDNVVVGGQSGVTKSVSANQMVSGTPAMKHSAALKIQAHMRKLPELLKTLKSLEERIASLEEKAKDY